MKRDEIEKMLVNANKAVRLGTSGKVAVLYIEPASMKQIFDLAMLGASVAEPREEEIEFIRGYMRLAPDVGPDQVRDFAKAFHAALLALKDRADV